MSSCQLRHTSSNHLTKLTIRQGIKLIIDEIRYFKSLVQDQSCLLTSITSWRDILNHYRRVQFARTRNNAWLDVSFPTMNRKPIKKRQGYIKIFQGMKEDSIFQQRINDKIRARNFRGRVHRRKVIRDRCWHCSIMYSRALRVALQNARNLRLISILKHLRLYAYWCDCSRTTSLLSFRGGL